MAYHVIRPDDEGWKELGPTDEGVVRRMLDVTGAGDLVHSRARVWRYPPGALGKPHSHDGGQEEVYVVLEGTLTMLLGDENERVQLPPQSVVSVGPGTNRQMRNEGDADVVVFIYGAPPPAE